MVYDGVYNFTERCCDTGAQGDVCTNADTCSGCGPDTNTWCDCDTGGDSDVCPNTDTNDHTDTSTRCYTHADTGSDGNVHTHTDTGPDSDSDGHRRRYPDIECGVSHRIYDGQ
jgi:hypothetical protein